MTIQEFNFLLAIAQYGWGKAQYHWTYLLLFDPEGNDVAKFRLRSPVNVGRTRRTEKTGKSKCVIPGCASVPPAVQGDDVRETSPASKNTKSRARH